MFPPSFRSLALALGLLVSFGSVGQSYALEDADPLKQLVEGLENGKPEAAEVWAKVLAGQSAHTTTDLWYLMDSEGSRGTQEALRTLLLETCAANTTLHQKHPLAPKDWQSRVAVSVEILGLIGGGSQADQVIQLLAVPAALLAADPTAYSLADQSRNLQLALTAAIERDGNTLDVLTRHYGKTARRVDSTLLRALGDSDQPRTAEVLAGWIGVRPRLDATVLNQISQALRRPNIRLEESGLNRIRPLLAQEGASLRVTVIRTLGFADDVGSIQTLIALLRDSDLAIREEALRALHRITAMTMEGHPDRWQNWYQEESDWWQNRAQDTLATLQFDRPNHMAEVLRELAAKRLFRREIAPRVLPLLADPRPEVVRLALATLDSLRPPLASVGKALLPVLDHPNPQIRKDADRVLRALGGEPDSLRQEASPQPAR